VIWIITSPERVNDEEKVIAALLSAGVARILLRKPNWSTEQYATLLNQLPPAYYHRLLIRDHPMLAAAYGLAGVHWSGVGMRQLVISEKADSFGATQKEELISLPNSYPAAIGNTKQPMHYTSPENFKENSTGIHTIEEITSTNIRIQTLLLSPVFNSISKPGYEGQFGRQLGNKNNRQILALGGVNHTNITWLKQWHFDGAALLGAIWEIPAYAVENYYRIQELWNRSDLL
jgi:thiamine-phosphate pyrophosphorylase